MFTFHSKRECDIFRTQNHQLIVFIAQVQLQNDQIILSSINERCHWRKADPEKIN